MLTACVQSIGGAGQAAVSATTAGQLSGTVRHEPRHDVDLIYWTVVSALVSSVQGSSSIPLTVRLGHAAAAFSAKTESRHCGSDTQLIGVPLHHRRRRLAATAGLSLSPSLHCSFHSKFIHTIKLIKYLPETENNGNKSVKFDVTECKGTRVVLLKLKLTTDGHCLDIIR